MEIERKAKALAAVYAVYDELVRTQPTACSPRCTSCCTTHVTVTTLEAYAIRESLLPGDWERVAKRLAAAEAVGRFRPRVTTNALAMVCAAGGEPPDEGQEVLPAACPLLADALCSIYTLRPFHCRCFISRAPCTPTGCADVEEFVICLHTAFLQIIEHIDADGCSGNLLDVLEVLGSEENRAAYAAGALPCTGNGLIANHPLQKLMLPPEHRGRIEPVLQKLQAIRV
jgi:hypothetical protein